MRKILAFALSLFTFLYAMSAVAEEIDVSAMSLDELVELQEKVVSRINEQLGTSSDVMYIGEYVCGVDIKPGRYLVTGLENKDYFELSLYPDVSMTDTEDRLIHEYLDSDDIYDLEIEDGMLLKVYAGSALITPRVKPSWAP